MAVPARPPAARLTVSRVPRRRPVVAVPARPLSTGQTFNRVFRRRRFTVPARLTSARLMVSRAPRRRRVVTVSVRRTSAWQTISFAPCRRRTATVPVALQMFNRILRRRLQGQDIRRVAFRVGVALDAVSFHILGDPVNPSSRRGRNSTACRLVCVQTHTMVKGMWRIKRHFQPCE